MAAPMNLAMAPAPVGKLRPAVHAQTQRYNAKVKLGRGFTIGELKAAGLTATYAKTIGIAVDARRTNKSEEAMNVNVDRLKAYMATVIVFDKKKNTAAVKSATQFVGTIQPLTKAKPTIVMESVEVPAVSSFIQMRKARKENKISGQRHALAERKKKD
jgi:large subunit ribosomal protein L13e